MSAKELIANPRDLRPHVVILGAGASVAALPTGDANRRRLPTMANLIELLGLNPILRGHGVDPTGRSFEELYSELHKTDPSAQVLYDIESVVPPREGA